MPTIAEAIRLPPSAPPFGNVEDHLTAVLLDLRDAGVVATTSTVLSRAGDVGIPPAVIAAIAARLRGQHEHR